MLKKLEKTLNKDQSVIYKKMATNDRLQICLPTGVGKGYLMRVDILKRLITEDVITIASHRLILNTQHIDDIIESLIDNINNVRFVFVGSDNYDMNKHQSNTKFVKELIKNKISFDELYLNTLSNKEIKNYIKENKRLGKKTIIVSTYHSLDKLEGVEIDTLYCDEAHTLATEKEGEFKSNFQSIDKKNVYFFTATPKDCADEDDKSFLMNNDEVFGERVGMDIKDAIKKGYITRPMIHIAIPDEYDQHDMDSLKNKTKFVIDSYNVHSDKVKEKSSDPDLIEAKMLVKCESVDEMWFLYQRLVNALNGQKIKVFAGASRKGSDGPSYEMNGRNLGKTEHLNSLKNLKNDDKAIVLHVDTLSEGVNVKGFTGVMFLTDNPPTIIKLLQNIGRGTRVLNEDRENFNKGLVNTDDYIGWVKPNTYVILPIFNPESETSQNYLSETIMKLKLGEKDANYIISIGDDMGKKDDNEVDDMLYKGEKDIRKKLVKVINHNIEEMVEDEQKSEEQLKLDALKKINFLKNLND